MPTRMPELSPSSTAASEEMTRAIAYARWRADLYCLWRLCGKRSCLRSRACRCDPRHCLPSLLLVPPEAQDFIIGFEDAFQQGVSFDAMMDDHEAEWAALMEWRELVLHTLPGVPAR